MDTTILYIIFGTMLVVGLIGQRLLNPVKNTGKLKLVNMGDQEMEEIGVYVMNKLSGDYNVETPKFQLGTLKGTNTIGNPSGDVAASYVGQIDMIVLDPNIMRNHDLLVEDLFGYLAHEFQHYLDKLELGDSKKWEKEYEKNVEYYELKADNFMNKTKFVLIEDYLKNYSE